MGLISNGTTLLDAGALDSGIATGAMTLLSTVTASSSSTIDFTSGIDSTYKEYIFKFIDIHPATDDVEFQVNFRDGSTAYDATKTSTFFYAYHNESDSATSLTYDTGSDLAQSTSFHQIAENIKNDNDKLSITKEINPKLIRIQNNSYLQDKHIKKIIMPRS